MLAIFALSLVMALALVGLAGSAGAQVPATTIPPEADDPNTTEMTANPTTGLVHGMEVRVNGPAPENGGGFVTQCIAGAATPNECSTEHAYVGGGHNQRSWRVDLRVSRFVDHSGGSVDCAEQACEIALFNFGDVLEKQASLAIAFDASVPPPARPEVTIRPRKDLVDRQTVTARLADFKPFERVYVHQCTEPASGAYDSCSSRGSATTEVDGTVQTDIVLVRSISNGTESVDCVEVRCYVSVTRNDGGLNPLPVRLRFDPEAEALPGTELKLSKRLGLVDGQMITAEVAHAGVGAESEYRWVHFTQCATADDGQTQHCTFVGETSGDGERLRAENLRVRRELRSGHGENTAVVDCAERIGRCVLHAYFGENAPVSKPLGFDPEVPPLQANVVLINRNKLEIGKEHKVKIDNYLGQQVEVRQCPREATSHEDPRCQILRVEHRYHPDQVNLERFVVPIRPVRHVGEDQEIDCVTRNACDLRVFGSEGPMRRILINFNRDAVPPEPVVRVTPNRKLLDGQVVRLRAKNILNVGLRVAVCEATSGRCRGVPFEEIKRTETTLVADVTMRRFVNQLDCAEKGRSCSLFLRGGNHTNRQEVLLKRLRFADVALPEIELTVSPSRKLIDGQELSITAVTGSSVRVFLRQCLVFEGEVSDCSFAQRMAVGEGGTHTDTLRAQREISGEDCAERYGRCVVMAAIDGVVRAVVPLGFDSDVDLPEPLEVSMQVTPRRNLADGQIVEVTVAGVDYTTIQQCAIIDGELASGSCRYLDSVVNSLFVERTVSVSVRRFLQPAGASTSWDCASEPRSCVLLIGPNHAGESVSVGLTFDPDAEPRILTVVVAPSEGLVDGQVVQIAGLNFFPGAGAYVFQCVGLSEDFEEGSCDVDNLMYVTVDDTGTFTTELAVSETIDGESCHEAICQIVVGSEIRNETVLSDPLQFS